MGRWEPDARGRLAQAAMELFHERGFPRTTVEDIAARAGLTERTFFRYFTDKREVLFWGSSALEKFLVASIDGAPKTTAPLDVVIAAVDAMSALFEARRPHSRKRQALIAAHQELQERELIKLASLASAVAAGLRKRGVAEPAASLCGEAGIAIFKVAFDAWVHDSAQQTLSHHIQEALGQLQLLMAPAPPAQPKAASTRKARTRLQR